MPVNVGDILRITARMSWGEDDIQNVYHLRVTAGDDEDNTDVLTDIAEDLEDAYDFILGRIPNEITFDSLEGYNLTDDEWMGVVGWPTLTAGTATADPMPPQNSPLVLFTTDVPRSQGRKFLPPFSVNEVQDDGTIDTVPLQNVESYMVSLLAGVVGTYIEAEYGNWNEALARFATWILGEARDIFATQRRRYFGSGS